MVRSYIRHPFDIPIEIVPETLEKPSDDQLKNISHGGLAFNSAVALKVGDIVRVRINLVNPDVKITGKVKWCKKKSSQFEVGLEFLDKGDEFKMRMIEQVCHIEHYKREVFAKEGRDISSQEAALEWIEKYAETFPKMESE